MAIIEILTVSGGNENESVEYNVKTLEKQGESQESVRKKLKELKKELENTILFKHPVYGASVSFSNPRGLVVKINFLYRNYARNIIREVAREQNLEV